MPREEPMKFTGLNIHRFKENPEELAFAKAWDAENRYGRILSYLLSTEQHNPPDPTPRDHVIAATVIQWLGSPVGKNFLESLGYVKRST